MSVEPSKIIFEKLRTLSGGRLTQKHMEIGTLIAKQLGRAVLAQLNKTNVKTHTNAEAHASATQKMTISKQGYALIQQFEGLRLNAYLDSANVATIGYGTIRYPNGTSVKMGDCCTTQQAEEWLKQDCQWVIETIEKHVKVTLTQAQYDALASLIYNIGTTQFVKSTLLKCLNQGNYQATAEQFDVWIYAGGKQVQGLINRRAREKALFLTAQ